MLYNGAAGLRYFLARGARHWNTFDDERSRHLAITHDFHPRRLFPQEPCFVKRLYGDARSRDARGRIADLNRNRLFLSRFKCRTAKLRQSLNKISFRGSYPMPRTRALPLHAATRVRAALPASSDSFPFFSGDHSMKSMKLHIYKEITRALLLRASYQFPPQRLAHSSRAAPRDISMPRLLPLR